MPACYYKYIPCDHARNELYTDDAIAARKLFFSKSSCREYARAMKLRFPVYTIRKYEILTGRNYVVI